MNLPPWWKAKRELHRLSKQILGLPGKVYDQFLATPHHDLFERHLVERFDGVVPRGDRVAIYLVFPSKGLLPSHKLAIKHLKECGYAPMVVSNLPITGADHTWLSQNTYKFLSRPNVGYDFGGYREGFLSLDDEIEHLNYLAFFNDSTWFPIPGSRDWLPQAEALDVAYAAAASSFGTPHVGFDDFRNIEWKVDVNLRNFHYCSFALLVRKELLHSRSFRRYWKSLPLTEQKNRVVRVGEIGMTKFVLRRGFTHGSTYDLATLPDVLNGYSDEAIFRVARNLITLGHHEASPLVELIQAAPDGPSLKLEREDLIKLILTVSGRIGVAYVLPEFLYKNHGFSFLKKSPLALNQRDSNIAIEFGKTLESPNGRIIEHEMHNIRQEKGLIGGFKVPSIPFIPPHEE
ncbi:rhamnan synthesis F family protein [Tritonibacter mobilis]|uniref:rhamnan synthesis F family protein n=1 Tax=Tritonibacter mobilis TaxID=379347 RepID=UPI0009BDB8A1|nr:rhamnan synthesis F family protein [Tritonibacter mobilis]